MRLRVLAACLLLTLPSAASAQGAPSVTGEVVVVGGSPWVVTEAWNGERGAIEVRGPGGSTRVPIEAPGWIAAAGDAGGIVVALAQPAPVAVRALWVPIAEGRPGTPAWLTIPRPAPDERAPVGVSVTARPDGFAVFWQEASTRDPNATWATFEARFDRRGQPAGAPRALPRVPWPIADALFVNGRTFLLLYYGGAAPDRTRLCGVHIDESGRPQEHPWWASPPSMIDEARLVVAGGRVIAVYRGGRYGTTLLEADVTTGSWGREAPAPRSHGAIAPDEAYGMRADGAAVRIERVRLSAERR